MTLLIKPNAVSSLSQLSIDADKDWGGRAITNLKGLAAGMTQGDLFFRGIASIQRLLPGVAGQFLITKGTGANPEWGDYAGRVERLFFLLSTMPVKSHSVIATNVPGVQSPVPLIIQNAGVFLVTPYASPLACGGAVYHDDSPLIDTDETTQANNATANDIHLLPSPGAVGDGFYFGLNNPFDRVVVNIGTAGVGTWTITWKYYNGVTWTALTIKTDETSHFRTSGLKGCHWVRPLDWTATLIAGMNLYWVKSEITAYTSMTTQPLGNQAWLGRY
ncbi:hypothetical protein C1O63_1558 [Dehalococcoides mccartyi]|uniref:hypothetical protein n=1 Tax=Dehalococcoides mccartyi TaxID=61435 RepID=UPI0002B7671A|nr:hypothetical protein [Dehalococcoides mccartyi]AGG07370.1 hypothetical protein btf_261 [Dehalococcoides mccartyi BTF08]AQW61801.1 hypothetical protein B1779_00480 [Dehalococcoides mccartyi]POZ58409.1 hypothetical protein C1O63_1558 [Dehalococcoides mccartyi]